MDNTMTPEEELKVINKLLEEEQELYNKRQKKLQEEDKKKVYQELFQDKVSGILGG